MNSYPAIDLEKLKKLNKQSKQQAVQQQQAEVQQTKVKQQQQQVAKVKAKQVEEQKFNKTLVSPLTPKPKLQVSWMLLVSLLKKRLGFQLLISLIT